MFDVLLALEELIVVQKINNKLDYYEWNQKKKNFFFYSFILLWNLKKLKWFLG